MEWRDGYLYSVCEGLFFAHLERQGYSVETYSAYEKDLRYFRSFLCACWGVGDFYVDEVGKEDLLRFMDEGRSRGHKVNTVARRLSTLKSFYKFLVYELDYPVDLAARIRLPKIYVPLTNVLSEREVMALLREARKLGADYHLLFSLLYFTGSRLTPVRTLKREHVSLDERRIYFPRVKGGKDLYLPLHEQVHSLLAVYVADVLSPVSVYMFPSKRVANQPLSGSDIRNKLKIIARRAGIMKDLTPHTLRHCTATHLTMKGVDQRTIASILGHADLRSTMRYQHLSVDHLREPLNRL